MKPSSQPNPQIDRQFLVDPRLFQKAASQPTHDTPLPASPPPEANSNQDAVRKRQLVDAEGFINPGKTARVNEPKPPPQILPQLMCSMY